MIGPVFQGIERLVVKRKKWWFLAICAFIKGLFLRTVKTRICLEKKKHVKRRFLWRSSSSRFMSAFWNFTTYSWHVAEQHPCRKLALIVVKCRPMT